jgi:hypothetical protein
MSSEMARCPECRKNDEVEVEPDMEGYNVYNAGMTLLFGGDREIGRMYFCRRCNMLFGEDL